MTKIKRKTEMPEGEMDYEHKGKKRAVKKGEMPPGNMEDEK